MSKDKRTFVIVNADGTESGAYSGKTPRQAAIKAIKADSNTINHLGIPITVRIRARGEKRIHIFRGHVTMENAPDNRPKWMPTVVKVAHVTKVGIERVDKIGAEPVKSDAITSETSDKANA